MRVAIVDDLEPDRAKLRRCLLKWDDGLEITEYRSGTELLQGCTRNVPDLLFMDIYMDGENGLAAVEQLRQITLDCVTIFVTSSRDDALRAFPLHPFDYVVKPWTEETIFRVMNEASALRMNDAGYAEFTVGRQKTKIQLSRVGYAASDNHHVKIVMQTGETLKSFSTFAEVSEVLLRDSRFLACNRGIVVNMDYIEKCTGRAFVMKNGDSLPMKVKDVPALEKAFAAYIFARTGRWR